jgi:hypothetical protein
MLLDLEILSKDPAPNGDAYAAGKFISIPGDTTDRLSGLQNHPNSAYHGAKPQAVGQLDSIVNDLIESIQHNVLPSPTERCQVSSLGFNKCAKADLAQPRPRYAYAEELHCTTPCIGREHRPL